MNLNLTPSILQTIGIIIIVIVASYQVRKDVRLHRQNHIQTPWYKQPSIIRLIGVLIILPSISAGFLEQMNVLPGFDTVMYIRICALCIGFGLLLYSVSLSQKKTP